MAGWDFEKPQNDSDKVEFTSFPEGITRVRIVDDEPYDRWVHWMPGVAKVGKGRSANCLGRGCPICEIRRRQKANKEKVTYQIQRKISIHIINRETGKLEIMEQSQTFFEDIRELVMDLREKGKSITEIDLRVRRRGLDSDTSWRIDLETNDDGTFKFEPLSESDAKLLEQRVNFKEYYKLQPLEFIIDVLNGTKWEDAYEKMKAEASQQEEQDNAESE